MALKKAQRQKARKTRCELVDVFLQESEFTGHSPLGGTPADMRGGAARPGQQAVAVFSRDSTGHAIPYMSFLCLIIFTSSIFSFFLRFIYIGEVFAEFLNNGFIDIEV